MNTKTRADIERDLAALLANFNGKEYAEPITPRTLFFADLGMASIDAVLLAETLEQRYATRFPFRELLVQAAETEVQDFSVGDLAAFVYRHFTPLSPGTPGERGRG